MANIVINEISQNYTYNIGNSSYATVAMPITASWGPGYSAELVSEAQDPYGDTLENVLWTRFPATQKGLEAFVATYRGPESCYRMANDYSYQMAMTLIAAGYDVLACRMVDGEKAKAVLALLAENPSGTEKLRPMGPEITVNAKYSGQFGNNLIVNINLIADLKNKSHLANIITSIKDSTGAAIPVENIVVNLIEDDNDSVPYILDAESDFLSLELNKPITETNLTVESGETLVFMLKTTDEDNSTIYKDITALSGGSDYVTDVPGTTSVQYAKIRYGEAYNAYVGQLSDLEVGQGEGNISQNKLDIITHNELVYSKTYRALSLLKDKLSYRPNRIILSGYDDQNLEAIEYRYRNDQDTSARDALLVISPLHRRLLAVSYASRCATGYIDTPWCLSRSGVSNDDPDNLGYVQKLATTREALSDSLYTSHSAFFAPWGEYRYQGTSKLYRCPPSFMALMIERAMILNQAVQYEWALPTDRSNKLNFGKLKYSVPKKILDIWQSGSGVNVNAITNIPDIGLSLWGNTTLFNLPVATYQALFNLSTRKLVNAVEDLAYKCGINITFQYNNNQAYNSFYAGMTPLLDTMKNVGAIKDYYVRMSADINGLDRVNANTVIGKIYLLVEGVVNDIKIDLIALPPSVDLNQFRV